jgi:hypothetical protein
MGYVSQVIVGMTKIQYVDSALITRNLPKLLGENKPNACGDDVYWAFNDIKWYDGYPEIDECETYFELLMDSTKENEIVFGALRMGEREDDSQEWGKPWEFDIYLNREIRYPIID